MLKAFMLGLQNNVAWQHGTEFAGRYNAHTNID